MREARPVLLVWLLLATVSLSLVLRASLAPPRGTVFSGTFYYTDDFYNYLGSVEQAQRGELVFRSKLASPALAPALVNLEWLLVGWLAAVLGGDAILAYRVFGLAALAALVWLADRSLSRCELPPASRLPALLLVFTGGGLGGPLYLLHALPGERALDLRLGAFPFVEALGNAHFVTGTTLLLAGVAAFAADRRWLGVAIGAALSLVRPYDAALLVAVEGASTVLGTPVRAWPRALLPVAVVAAMLPYPLWLFGAAPGFRVFSSAAYARVAPATLDLLTALGPAVLLAAAAARSWRASRPPARAFLTRLALWALFAVALASTRVVSFGLQFAVGVGVPLLMLAAVGLARVGRGALRAAVPLMACSAVVAVWLCTVPTPKTHPPAERWRIAQALRPACRPGELVLAPPDIGLYVGGLTPCWPYVSHAAAPDYGERSGAVETFYSASTPPAWRAAFLQQHCVAHVVLPPGLPPGWLGNGDYEAKLAASGGPRVLTVWSRAPGGSCATRSAGDFR